MDDIEIIDNISADTIEVGDQIIVVGDHIQVSSVTDSDDIDEVVVTGYSHDSGDSVEYSLFADDYFDVWTV